MRKGKEADDRLDDMRQENDGLREELAAAQTEIEALTAWKNALARGC